MVTLDDIRALANSRDTDETEAGHTCAVIGMALLRHSPVEQVVIAVATLDAFATSFGLNPTDVVAACKGAKA